MKRLGFLLAGAVLSLIAATGAGATVVTFDDLPGSGVVPDGYAGITWNGQWFYVGGSTPPYVPESPPNSAASFYRNADFKFSSPVVFDGAYFSGFDFATVSFNLLLGGSTVATSGGLDPSSTPTFLSSSYGGLVDEVQVHSLEPGYYTMDNVTFNEGIPNGVPEPSTWLTMLLGLGGLGMAMRQRRLARAT
jgi:hypothetical protein